MFYAGMALSLWITIGSCISLGQNGIASFASLIVYGVVGLIVWLLMKSYIKKDPANREMKLLTPTDIEG